MRFSYAIFDMDGTLVDSMGFWDLSCAEFIQHAGVTDKNLLDILKPMTLEQIVAYLRDNLHLDVTKELLTQNVYQQMIQHYKNDVRAKPGVRSFLSSLQEKNIRMCVASTSPASMVDICLRSLKLDSYFEFLLSSEEIGIGKTEPDIFYEAARRMGALPKETMVFEDSLTAGLTAKRAGFQTAAVFDAIGIAEWDDFYPQADVVIRDWNEAQQLLI